MKSSIVFSFSLLFSMAVFGQCKSASFAGFFSESAAPFSSCAAIFYNNQVLVDDYSPQGKCRVSMNAKGKLTLAEVNLSDKGAWPMSFTGFKVAIKNSKTNTLWMYSEETFYEVKLEDILSKCEKDDKIIIMTVDNEFSLPHHEIEIFDGC